MKTIITITTTSDKGFNTDHKTTKHEYSEPVTVQMVKDLLDMESSTSILDALLIQQKEVKEEEPEQLPVDGLEPLPIPRVNVVDPYGKVIVTGYYFYHIARQVCPLGDSLKREDVVHSVVLDGSADWNMPIEVKMYRVEPPNHIEVVK